MKYTPLFLEKRLMRSYYNFRRMLPESLGGLHYRRFVFMHIPKTAGTSLNLYFKSRFGSFRSGNAMLMTDSDCPSLLEKARHATFVGGHFGYDTFEKINKEAFCFTFLRDPRERVLSAYKFMLSYKQQNYRIDECDFEEFLELDNEFVRRLIENTQCRQLSSSYEHLFTHGEPSEVQLRSAIQNLSKFHYVGLVEHFETDLQAIAHILGMDIPTRPLMANTSEGHAKKSGFKLEPVSITRRAEALLEQHVCWDQVIYDEAKNVRKEIRSKVFQ